MPPVVEVQSLNHWTAREVPTNMMEGRTALCQVLVCIAEDVRPWAWLQEAYIPEQDLEMNEDSRWRHGEHQTGEMENGDDDGDGVSPTAGPLPLLCPLAGTTPHPHPMSPFVFSPNCHHLPLHHQSRLPSPGAIASSPRAVTLAVFSTATSSPS